MATKKTYTKRTHKDIDTGSHPTSSTLSPRPPSSQPHPTLAGLRTTATDTVRPSCTRRSSDTALPPTTAGRAGCNYFGAQHNHHHTHHPTTQHPTISTPIGQPPRHTRFGLAGCERWGVVAAGCKQHEPEISSTMYKSAVADGGQVLHLINETYKRMELRVKLGGRFRLLGHRSVFTVHSLL